MKIFSWSDPKYFHFITALVRSIRYHENRHDIFLLLMNFEEEQKEMVTTAFNNDSKVHPIYMSADDLPFVVKYPREFHRNCRPRYIVELMEEYQEPFVTFAANGIIRCRLDYIEKYLEDNDFLFLERTQEMQKRTFNTVRHFHKAVKRGAVNGTPLQYGNMVLMGTHGIAYNERTMEVLRLWRDLIETQAAINEYKNDMGLFAQALMLTEDKIGEYFRLVTGAHIPRHKHPFCDTSFDDGSNIWFAKSKAKWNNKKYLKAVEFFNNYKYEL